jgi:predicted dehydrogenase
MHYEILISYGIIGCGGAGKNYASVIIESNNSSLYAVSSRNIMNAINLSKEIKVSLLCKLMK